MKKKFCKHIVLTTLFSILFSAKCVFAMPAYSEPTQYVQPDGSVIELYSYGDEHYNFVGDAEGYMLEKNEDGKYEYVTYDSPVMMMAALDDIDSRPANAVKGFDLYEKTQNIPENIEYPQSSYPPVSLFNTKSTTPPGLNLITIAVEFNDVKFPESGFDGQGIYDRVFSTDEDVISVNNYYKEVSSGIMQFVPAFEMTENDISADGYGKVADGIIKVLIDGNHPDPQSYSTDAEKDAAVESIIKNAIAIVDEYIDFNDFDIEKKTDVNGKSYIWDEELTFCFIVAGYEGSVTKTYTDNSVWAHKFRVPGGIECDGLTLLDYSQAANYNGEIRYWPSSYAMVGTMYDSERPMGIGSLCHELAHILGLPDLYNTAGSTNYDNIYTLSLMAKGSWGKKDTSSVPSSMPTHLDAWCKFRKGWFKDGEAAGIDITELTDGKTASTKILPALSDENGIKFLLVFTNDESEYFLLENRVFEGYDAALKNYGYKDFPALTSTGIAIWHIDEDIIETNFSTNSINTTSTPGVSLVRSGMGSDEFYNNSQPLWSSGINRIPFFGKLSYPNNKLNTPYNGSVDSGVEIEFLSTPSEQMIVRFGDNHVKKAMYAKDGNVSVRLFNNTDAPVTVTPIVAVYNGTTLDDVVSLSELTVKSGETAITNTKPFSLERSRGYKIFGFDFDDLKPAFEPLRFSLK